MYVMFVLMVLVLHWWFGIILSNLNLFLIVQSSVRMKLVMVSSNLEVGLGSGLVLRSTRFFNISNQFISNQGSGFLKITIEYNGLLLC